MENNREQGLMKASPEWMAENYERFNKELFDGELGDCRFEIFTSGRGSQGRTLGRFCLEGRDLYVNRDRSDYNGYARRMYMQRFGDALDIGRDNFVALCSPVIKLNGNYSGTERSLQTTLVHEMCHYYNYMDGYAPIQAHGPLFMEIASIVSSRSNGMFTIQRLATAEEKSGYQLSDEMQKKRMKRILAKPQMLKKRKETIMRNSLAVYVLKEDGTSELSIINSSNVSVLTAIYNRFVYGTGRGVALEILESFSPALINELQRMGYRKVFRTYRAWSIKNQDLAGLIKSYTYEYLISPEEAKKIRIGMGLEKNESMTAIGDIVESVIKEYVKNIEDDNRIEVSGLDLGAESPFEYAGLN